MDSASANRKQLAGIRDADAIMRGNRPICLYHPFWKLGKVIASQKDFNQKTHPTLVLGICGRATNGTMQKAV
jgi:hypothetical protein